MAEQYNFKNIRALLTEGFTDKELRTLCFDVLAFRPVYSQLARATGKTEIVQQLLEYVEQKELIGTLLDQAKKDNPAKYEKYRPYEVTTSLTISKGVYEIGDGISEQEKFDLVVPTYPTISSESSDIRGKSQRARIRILIADDQAIAREGIQRILEHEDDIEIVGIVQTAPEVLLEIRKKNPDVVLLDLQWHRDDQAMDNVIAQLRQEYSNICVIGLTVHDHLVKLAKAAGAMWVVTKDVSKDELLRVIRAGYVAIANVRSD